MELSFAEVAVLAAANRPKGKATLAYDAAQLYKSTKFDRQVAEAEIASLEARGFLRRRQPDLYLSITREGWTALLQSLPVIENLRAALAGVSYRSIT